MSLKIKVVLILVPVLILYTVAGILTNHLLLLPSFLSLEQIETKKNMRRPVQAIQREIHHLSSLAHDWSAWDDTYEYALTEYPEYVTEHIPFSSFLDNQLNLICITNLDGKILFKKAYDLVTEEPIDIPEIPDRIFPENHPLISFPSQTAPLSDVQISGLYTTSRYPMLITSRPVLTNDNEGPIRGSLIMGRFLTPGVVKNLIAQTEVPFETISANRFRENDIKPPVVSLLNGTESSYIDMINSDTIVTYSVINDITGSPAVVIKAEMNRNISKKGHLSMKYVIGSTCIMGLCVFSVILILLHVSILRPVSRLARHASTIGKTGDLSGRLDFKRNDEIGRLARKLDTMLEQLADARNRLLEQTYYSGLAGMASDIIHNAGNILMPVSANISSMLDKCRSIPFDTIDTTMQELQENSTDHTRKQSLFEYMQLSVSTMKETIQENEKQLEELSEYFAEIEKVLIDLDEYSRSGMTSEPISISDIVNNSVSMIPRRIKTKVTVTIQPGLESLPDIIGERLVLIQVIITVINTSAELAVQHDSDTPEVTIDGQYHIKTISDQPSVVHIKIRNNGPALTDDTIRQMFSREKQTSHHTGLHWCSNVISSMGGTLSAQSDASGTGSVFHLILSTKEM